MEDLIPVSSTGTWLGADVGLAFLRHCSSFAALTALRLTDDTTDDSYPLAYEHSLERVACALGGQTVPLRSRLSRRCSQAMTGDIDTRAS